MPVLVLAARDGKRLVVTLGFHQLWKASVGHLRGYDMSAFGLQGMGEEAKKRMSSESEPHPTRGRDFDLNRAKSCTEQPFRDLRRSRYTTLTPLREALSFAQDPSQLSRRTTTLGCIATTTCVFDSASGDVRLVSSCGIGGSS